jgi:hypothetical protein
MNSEADPLMAVELCMSTPLAVVVLVLLESNEHSEHTGLVIPRSACVGDQPRQRALLTAAQAAQMRGSPKDHRHQTRPQRVLVRLNGNWTPLTMPGDP